jgi:alanyl-tRNA synthetase
MEYMSLNTIREKYLEFFEERGHLRLPSFSLVPKNDPSILLINAGMTPMKAYFTGKETPPSKRVTTCQKCIRTGDIDNVGYTDRHGTYFEMLGNFSFGDYFKEEMIPWIWEFCTKVLGMEEDRLYPSVYEEDDEAFNIWHEKIGLPKDRIYRFGKADNFWEHGTGPSGPCSEVYYDRGEQYSCGSPDCAPGCECDRFVEFWNSVFTQFDKQEDGTYLPLAQKNIDTGVGLERLATIVQDVGSIFEVDTVKSILDLVCELAGVTYHEDAKQDISIRIITDHIRSTVMMIGDGITPSNNGRGYVLRRLMRRAIRHGQRLGIEGAFLKTLAEEVIRQNEHAYPELIEHKDFIMNTIANEERTFARTLEQGNQLVAQYIEQAKADGAQELSGEDVFRLHDTYGFPLDLTREIAEDQDLGVDEAGFNTLMEEQKARASENTSQNVKTAWGGMAFPEEVSHLEPTVFTGYETLEDKAQVLSLLVESEDKASLETRESLGEGQAFILITDKTPFYGTGGGQEGDFGWAYQGETEVHILSTTKTPAGLYLHHAEVDQGIIECGKAIDLKVDKENRLATARNHTVTHLLHQALRDVLGKHVTQQGSEVNSHHLRFDFSHYQALTADELEEVSRLVNQAILADYPVLTDIMPIDEAKAQGAMALFDEKYGDAVRVLSIGDYSKELCGGTHLKHTAQAGSFRITQESSIAAGVRRIEAVTGFEAIRYAKEDRLALADLGAMLKTSQEELSAKVRQLLEDNRQLKREVENLENAQARAKNADLTDRAKKVKDFNVLVTEVQVQDQNQMRELGDLLRDKLEPSILFLVRKSDSGLNFLAMASDEAVKAGIHCGNIVRECAKLAGGGGGGRPNMAQAGAKEVDKLDEVLAKASSLIEDVL